VVRIKSKIINLHVESALVSAIRLRRYWMTQGYSEKEAMEKALKQATGMLKSLGISPKKLYESFDDLEKTCKSFKKMIKERWLKSEK